MLEQAENSTSPEEGNAFDVNRPPFDKKERIVLASLGGFGAMILILGYFQFFSHIVNSVDPRLVKAPQSAESSFTPAKAGLDLSKTDELKKKDTDDDGLSDYEELFTYKTSPYLADTDGDSSLDNVEIKNGTDPNCPEGRICLDDAGLGGGIQSAVPIGEISEQSLKLSPGELEVQLRAAVPVSKIRELLLQSGQLTKDQIDQLDDATIQQVYDEALKNLDTNKK